MSPFGSSYGLETRRIAKMGPVDYSMLVGRHHAASSPKFQLQLTCRMVSWRTSQLQATDECRVKRKDRGDPIA